MEEDQEGGRVPHEDDHLLVKLSLMADYTNVGAIKGEACICHFSCIIIMMS